MRIAVATWGSRGDFEPYLALARALADAQHEVRLAAPNRPEFARAAAQQGLEFFPLGEAIDPEEFRRVIASALKWRSTTIQYRAIVKTRLVSSFAKAYPGCCELAAWSDLLVAHHIQIASRLAAERLDRPLVTGMLNSMGLRSRHHPPPGLPNLGQRCNDLLWTLVHLHAQLALGGPINRLRRSVGLRGHRDVLSEGVGGAALNLIAASPSVIPPAPDWPAQQQITGYWFVERPGWTPPAPLEAFLQRGSTPIAITFGSLSTPDDAKLTGVLIEGVIRSGVRAVIPAGWLRIERDALPSEVFVAGDVPYHWLFPRVAAVVHHGGAGTTAAALRAGIPSAFVPHVADNGYWARTVHDLGAAPAPIPYRRLTAGRLASVIREIVDDPAYRHRASQIARLVGQDDGLGRAVRLIESFGQARIEPRVPI